jgi:phage anti-repressor protein
MSNYQLIPVFTGKISGISVQLVDARELHTFLESKQDFSTWLKKRIADYDFLQDIDFIMPEKNGTQKSITYGNDKIDYHLTLDMAKELSMVERNAKGKQARRYFIECEKRSLCGFPEFLNPITEPIEIEDFEWRYQAIMQMLQNLKNATVTVKLTGAELLARKRLEK